MSRKFSGALIIICKKFIDFKPIYCFNCFGCSFYWSAIWPGFSYRYLLLLFRDAPVEVWAMTKTPIMVSVVFTCLSVFSLYLYGKQVKTMLKRYFWGVSNSKLLKGSLMSHRKTCILIEKPISSDYFSRLHGKYCLIIGI